MSPNKQKILELEKTGEYVFHGSTNGEIEILEPRQSTHIEDITNLDDDGEPDGLPAVAATPYAEIAIFRAIVNGANLSMPHTSGFGFKRDHKDQMYFRIRPEEALDQVYDNKKGYVYIFNKTDFEPYLRDGEPDESAMEWRCYKPIKPLEIIEVTSADLPPKNEIEIY
ncbi:MAG: hypothetical protein KBC48_02050 [Candidatus Pacebacteria bacterium]|nr:hypothetical protein [Candidatus Paceibacterota bacterium]